MLKKRNLLFLSLLILGVFLITGCWLIPTPTYTVTFNSQGGSAVDPQTVEHGGLATEPADPTKEVYAFGGWYKESGCTNAWNFATDTVTSDITLYAKWATNVYTVTFDSQGGSYVGSQTVEHGGKASRPTAPTKTGYTFAGWYKESGCTNPWNFTTDTVTFDVTLYAQWTPLYALRDTGPAGGWIFYVKEGGYSDGWMYLEAAPVDQTSRVWGIYDHDVSGADGTAIGTGQQNTLDIIAGDVLADKAADECANYSIVNGCVTYDDWFLPSKDELNLIYTNLKAQGVGGFAGGHYWSSSEYIAYLAWTQYFDDGDQHYGNKFNPYLVRAVRAF